MFIAVSILAFGLLIAFHEFGHMWVARRMGMRVERFSIGFGPALYTWRRGETEYVLSALPLGGYVKVAGMAVEDEVDADDPGSYANKSAWRRFLVIAAGPFANYLLAFAIGVPLLLVGVTVPDMASKVGTVADGTAAHAAGLVAGDEIVRVGDVEVTRFEQLPAAMTTATGGVEGTEIPLVVRRDGQTLTLQVTPTKSGERMVLGVRPAQVRRPGMSFLAAVPEALHNIHKVNAATIDMFGKMLTREEKPELSGPIGILSQTAEQAERGALYFFMTVWYISIAVGFFNLLPVPGLDGGRLTFLIYEIVARRRVNQRVEGWIHTVGILALLVLIVVVSYGDIMKKFGS